MWRSANEVRGCLDIEQVGRETKVTNEKRLY